MTGKPGGPGGRGPLNLAFVQRFHRKKAGKMIANANSNDVEERSCVAGIVKFDCWNLDRLSVDSIAFMRPGSGAVCYAGLS